MFTMGHATFLYGQAEHLRGRLSQPGHHQARHGGGAPAAGLGGGSQRAQRPPLREHCVRLLPDQPWVRQHHLPPVHRLPGPVTKLQDGVRVCELFDCPDSQGSTAPAQELFTVTADGTDKTGTFEKVTVLEDFLVNACCEPGAWPQMCRSTIRRLLLSIFKLVSLAVEPHLLQPGQASGG